MKAILAAACLALGACSPAAVTSAPAPLARTVIDEQAIRLVWEGFNTALDAINVLRRTGVIQDGSAFARSLADVIDRTTLALTAASAAQRAGNAGDYVTAMNEAKDALLAMRDLLQKGV